MVEGLEYAGGEPLDAEVARQRGQPVELTRFLSIATGFAAALGQAHRQGLIHLDVRPANALVDAAGHVWLTGFGVASRLPRERPSPEVAEFSAGSLPYMAPEQTGRMNRSVDSRSDLYSLGVTLYELSTGRLPFTASDPMEWVHCHIARQPISPRELVPDLPGPVADIIMKLLAKTAEERYQTAVGLERDLQRCLKKWGTHGRVDEFPLGEHDKPDRLLIPEKLYGRAREVAALTSSFRRVVATGMPELVLISGYSGIGKSSVVSELHKVLVPFQGLFATGKFDQYMRGIPYATLAQAFQSLVRQILSKSEGELRRWREALQEALGANGLLIAALIPELELVIGKQPPVPDLSPQDAQRRFQTVLQRFIGVFARPEHPLVLFLDDLQWIDAATIDLLENLLAQRDSRHLLLIGAYRDNEVESPHPLRAKLEAIRRAGAPVHDIVLGPLSDADLVQLITDSLHCGPKRARPLIQLIRLKTGGNPFFAIQFLYALEEEALLIFDHANSRWAWDLERIHAKQYTDNVVDLMVAKLHRLPADTLAEICQLACVGSSATFALLATICQSSPESLHKSFGEAVRAGLVVRSADAYAWRHDRIQEAAYSMIPDAARTEAHLRIGRLLLAHTSPEERDAIIFKMVGQFNRSTALLRSPEEREQVAQLNLLAGKRAKNATAYSAALTYFAVGRALLAEDCWTRQYPLTFEFELQRAECEFLTGELATAQERLSMLASCAVQLIDQAAVTCLRVDLYIILVRPERAVEVALEYLQRVGFEVSPHPKDAEVRQEYQRIWQRLGHKRIEDLIDLPPLSDPGRRATLDVLNKLVVSALYKDPKLHQLLLAHMVNFSMEHGNSAASCVGYATLGRVLAAEFADYAAALRFGQLSLDLVDKRGLDTFKARVYFTFGTGISPWAQHLRLGLAFLVRAADEAYKIGDLPYIGFCHSNIVGNLLSAGEPLPEVDRAALEGLEFARKTGSGIVVAFILGQLRLIRALTGRACDFKSFDNEEFDVEKFERRLDADPSLAIAARIYWSRRLQALVFEGDHASALEAASRSQTLFRLPQPNIEHAEYHFYAALAEAGSVGGIAHLEAVRAHHLQLQVWAGNCPENFASRAALVGAELARLEGRELEAERLYVQAVDSARVSGFIHNEALAYELAARFYASRGFADIAEMCLVRARDGYRRWGADGKVRRLEARHPELAMAGATGGTQTAPSADQGFDVAAVVEASQALSGEMLLPRLIERLMRIAVEHAGAERGLLILIRDGTPWIEAQATTGPGKIEVATWRAPITSSALPLSVLHYAIRTQERVLLDDASSDNVYSKDEYVRVTRSRSVLCLPFVKQAKLIGALYLENNLTPGAFTPSRVTVLELLAAQAAISLENAVLYSDLRRSEAFLAEAQRISQTGSFGRSVASGKFYWSQENYNILEYDRSVPASVDLALERVHPEDRERVRRTLEAAMREKTDFDSEHRMLMPDGRVKHVHTSGRAVNTGDLEYVGSVRDITERTRAEEALRQAQGDLARIHRVTTMGELAASLSHELGQPITGAMTNAKTCLRILGRDAPDLDEVRIAVTKLARDAQRAVEIIRRIRSQFTRGAPDREVIDVNEIHRETVALLRDESVRYNISVRTELAADLPQIFGDRVQLQQVAMNLIVNGIEAMKDVDGIREMVIKSQPVGSEQILVSVSDTGIGFPPQLAEQIFVPFFTTKTGGTGMGLRISRSIIESHGGRLWAVATPGGGATFHLNLPAAATASHSRAS
jgi:predicted ATPase/signal transduction histidine kinase